MTPTILLLQKSNLNLVQEIDWSLHHDQGYVVRDPNSQDDLLYLSESEYKRLLRITLSNEVHLVVLARPKDDAASARARFSGSSDPGLKPQIPLILEDLESSRYRLMNLIPGWKISDSMIEIKRNFNQFIPSIYRNANSWLGNAQSHTRFSDVWKLSNYFDSIHKNMGINQVIGRMKVHLFVLNSYVAGTPLTSTHSIGLRIRLTHGLPASWPLSWRQNVRAGRINSIRIYSTVLQSYKALKGIYNDPDLSTITAPRYEGFPSSEVYDRLSGFQSILGTKATRLSPSNLIPSEEEGFRGIPSTALPITVKAGPNSPLAIFSSYWDAIALWLKRYDASPLIPARDRDIINFMSYFEHFAPDVITFIKKLVDALPYTDPQFRDLNLNQRPEVVKAQDKTGIIKNLKVSKLALKYEAAGKVRIFAIVDYWTQEALRPLHEKIFSVLKDLPTDATFNQTEAVKQFSSRYYRNVYSFDLKSATDLIPQQLYEVALSIFLGKEGAMSWVQLLTDRDYFLKDVPYRYSRGQPMGALSSWAGLALVHHYMVYLAAKRAYPDMRFFRDYLVLGDDIVIADSSVAKHYLEVCTDYGITVGLPKSFQSTLGFFQFASQNMLFDVNLSPISVKEALAANSLPARVEFSARLVNKGFIGVNPLELLRSSMSYANWRKVSKELTKGQFSLSMRHHLLSLLTPIILGLPDKVSADRLYLRTIMTVLHGSYHSIVNINVSSPETESMSTRRFGYNLANMLINYLDKQIREIYPKLSKTYQYSTGNPFHRMFIVALHKRRGMNDMFKVSRIERDLRALQLELVFLTNELFYLEYDLGIVYTIPTSYFKRLLSLIQELNSLQPSMVEGDQIVLTKDVSNARYSSFLSKDLKLISASAKMFGNIHVAGGM